MSAERGVIRNEARAKQLNSFKDLLRMRNITPTDIDGLIDYNGNAFIYFEGKYGKDKILDIGQRKALENVVKSHWKANHPSMALLFWHDTPIDCSVQVAFMFVKGIYTLRTIPCLTGRRHGESNWYFPQTEHIKMMSAVSYFEETFKGYNL